MGAFGARLGGSARICPAGTWEKEVVAQGPLQPVQRSWAPVTDLSIVGANTQQRRGSGMRGSLLVMLSPVVGPVHIRTHKQSYQDLTSRLRKPSWGRGGTWAVAQACA